MPLIAFLGLVHLAVPLPFLVLGRGRRCDQCGIDDRAFPKKQAFLGEMSVDRIEDGFGQLMRFQQVAEVEECGGIWRRFAAQINTDKATDGLTVVKRIFCPFIGQTKALLRDIHAQHPLQPNRRSTTSAAARVIRRNRFFQLNPRRDGFNCAQKSIPAGLLLLGSVFQFRKTRLHPFLPLNISSVTFSQIDDLFQPVRGNKSVFP